MAKSRPRVPLPATITLPSSERTIQVNHCKMPTCSNFGVPARWQPGKTGPSPDRDMHYKVHSTSKGKIPSIRCKGCLDNPPIKSNSSIVREIERLAEESGIWTLEEQKGCGNAECENHARPVAFHREEYRKFGKSKSGGQYYECRRCCRRTLISDPVRLHDHNRRVAVDVFSRVANKSPVRGTVRGARLKSTQAYYQILDFIYRRCRSYSGAVDRALIDGRLGLPEDINVQADAQVYQLNWQSRLDRRNIELSAYCTVDADSHFVLGFHCNFDGRVDPFEINAESARTGDLKRPEPFREHGHYWLAGDELRAGRAMARRNDRTQLELQARVEDLYAAAASREDVENIELEVLDTTFTTPFLRGGLQVHMPYTAYAHWFLLHRLLSGAGVKHVQLNSDIDSMTRAAFLSAFAEEVKRGDAHAFFVNYIKFQTIDERRRILRESKREREAFRQTLPESVRDDHQAVSRAMMMAKISNRRKHGKWKDEWVFHPLPTVNEPHKAMSWLTPSADLDEGRAADMFLRSGLNCVDNVFMKTRRLFNGFERPIGTSSTHNKVWHGYAPYNPAMAAKYLTIWRAVNNFVFVGDDEATPAMRLGFAKTPLDFEDILWPGQRVPRPKQIRRRGKKAIAT